MKIKNLYVTEQEVIADIKVNFFVTKQVVVRALDLAFMFNDPENWDDIEALEPITIKEELIKMTDELRKPENEQMLIEMLLKISGHHPNSMEVNHIRMMLNDKDYAKELRKSIGR